jgi:hypothetical protein
MKLRMVFPQTGKLKEHLIRFLNQNSEKEKKPGPDLFSLWNVLSQAKSKPAKEEIEVRGQEIIIMQLKSISKVLK